VGTPTTSIGGENMQGEEQQEIVKKVQKIAGTHRKFLLTSCIAKHLGEHPPFYWTKCLQLLVSSGQLNCNRNLDFYHAQYWLNPTYAQKLKAKLNIYYLKDKLEPNVWQVLFYGKLPPHWNPPSVMPTISLSRNGNQCQLPLNQIQYHNCPPIFYSELELKQYVYRVIADFTLAVQTIKGSLK